MQKSLTAFFSLFIFGASFCQGSSIDQAKALFAQYKGQIAEQVLLINEKEKIIEGLVAEKQSDNKKLKKALKDRYILQFELRKTKKQVAELQSKLVKSEIQVKELTSQVDSFERHQKQFDSVTQIHLVRQGREELIQKAKKEALEQYRKLESPQVGFFERHEPFLFFSPGYQFGIKPLKFFQGPSFHASWGALFSGDENIFLGLCSGADYFAAEDFSLLPICVSARIAFGDGFVFKSNNGEKLINHDISYGLFEAGPSLLLGKGNSNIKSGGFYSKLGVGGMFKAGKNLTVGPEFTWKWLSTNFLEKDGKQEKKFLSTFDLRVTFAFYLNR